MGKLTTEQAKKFMEAAKNAETNPIDDKFYPESKITTADKIDTGKPKKLPSKKNRMLNIDRSFLNKDIKFKKPEPFNPKNVPEFKRPKPFNPNEMSDAKKYKYSKGGGMDMGQMPNTVKPRPRGNPGIVENVVGKGGDYIKDLID